MTEHVTLTDRDSIPRVVEAMTLEEKARFVAGAKAFQTNGIERLGIPAFVPADGHNVVRANVSSVQYVGSRYEYLLSVGSSTVHADCLKPGHQGEVDLVIDPENIFLYPQKQAVPA